MFETRKTNHPFPPLYDSSATCLILGSFPSVQSFEQGYYYANKTNRFYAVLSALFGEDFVSVNWVGKQQLLHKHRIAIYDVIGSCTLTGSSDATIADVHPTDLEALLNQAPIRRIYCNGNRAYQEYLRYFAHLNVPVFLLPSTSPANAKMRLPDLVLAWSILLDHH